MNKKKRFLFSTREGRLRLGNKNKQDLFCISLGLQ